MSRSDLELEKYHAASQRRSQIANPAPLYDCHDLDAVY